MNIELSRRVAKIMDSIYSQLSFDDYTQFIRRISMAESFDKLSSFDKKIILDIENKK